MTAAAKRRRKAWRKQWEQKNRDKLRAASKRFRDTHRAQLSAEKRAYFLANKDRIRERMRAWLRRRMLEPEFRERRSARQQAWRAAKAAGANNPAA